MPYNIGLANTSKWLHTTFLQPHADSFVLKITISYSRANPLQMNVLSICVILCNQCHHVSSASYFLMFNWTSRWQAGIWGHLGHYPVAPYTSTWSPKSHGHGHEWLISIHFYGMSIVPFISEIRLFQSLTIKIHGQSHARGQRSGSHCRVSNLSIYFLFMSIGPVIPKIQLLKTWPWIPKAKVMANVKTNYIWGEVLNRCIQFSFVAIEAIFHLI